MLLTTSIATATDLHRSSSLTRTRTLIVTLVGSHVVSWGFSPHSGTLHVFLPTGCLEVPRTDARGRGGAPVRLQHHTYRPYYAATAATATAATATAAAAVAVVATATATAAAAAAAVVVVVVVVVVVATATAAAADDADDSDAAAAAADADADEEDDDGRSTGAGAGAADVVADDGADGLDGLVGWMSR